MSVQGAEVVFNGLFASEIHPNLTIKYFEYGYLHVVGAASFRFPNKNAGVD